MRQTKHNGDLLVSKSKREISTKVLTELAQGLSRASVSLKGLYDGDLGVCLFLFLYSELTDDQKIESVAFKRIEQNFYSLIEPSIMGFKNDYSLRSGLLGLDFSLTLFGESEFIEVDKGIFSALEKVIKPYLYIDNLLDFSISTGICGIGLYLINKLNSTSRLMSRSGKSEKELLMKVLSYSELSFNYATKVDSRNHRSSVQLLSDNIEYSFVPLFCEARFVFSNDVKFLDKLASIAYRLLDFYKSKTSFTHNEKYEKILIANSLYIASTHLRDKRLKREAFEIIESSVQVKSPHGDNNISLGNGLTGVMYIYFRLYKFENLSSLSTEIKQMFKNIMGILEKQIRDNTIKDSDHCFSSGLSGIGLALLSVISEKQNRCDSLLGLGKPAT